MKFTSALASAFLVAATAAADVACLVNGESVAVVDSESGVCPFTIPEEYPVNFEFTSLEDYDVTFYYAEPENTKYFTDIVNAGRVIEIPASILLGAPPVPVFQVHLEESPAANSTTAIRRRLLKSGQIAPRDEQDQFLAMAEATEGTALPNGLEFSVEPVSSSSAAASGEMTSSEGMVTETNVETTIVTITSCSDDKCAATTVPATASAVTTTVEGEETITTTWCPMTTVVTITSCADDKCHETTVPATPSLTTETKEGEVTSYYTYCPLTEEDSTVTNVETSVVTITSCADDKCHESTVPATMGETSSTMEGGEVTTYTTWCPVTSTVAAESTPATEAAETTPAPAPTTAAPSTVAGESTTMATSAASMPSGESPISTWEGAGNKVGSSLIAVALVPLAGLLF